MTFYNQEFCLILPIWHLPHYEENAKVNEFEGGARTACKNNGLCKRCCYFIIRWYSFNSTVCLNLYLTYEYLHTLRSVVKKHSAKWNFFASKEKWNLTRNVMCCNNCDDMFHLCSHFENVSIFVGLHITQSNIYDGDFIAKIESL